MRTTLNIQDPLFISSPNDGGLLYAHRHLLIPLLHEDATGLSTTTDGLLWNVQTAGFPKFWQIKRGQLHSVTVGQVPLDLHDVLVDGSAMYAVFTETNEVVRLDDVFQVVERWKFGDEPDCTHVNCIALFGDRLIASMFGVFDQHRGYKHQTRMAGRVIDVRTGELLIEGLSQPHSLVVAGDELWLCSSEDRALHVYDRNFQRQRQVTLPGYTRGLALGTNCVYVGLSRSRNLKPGEAGEFTSGVIALLDRHSLDVIGYMPIPWNEIYDIKIATSANVVADVMAATWVYERNVVELERAEVRRKLNQAEEDLRHRDVDLQSIRDALMRAKQQTADAEASGTAVVNRIVEQATDDLKRLMEQVAFGKSEVHRLTEVVEATKLEGNAEATRIAEQATDDLKRMMEQMVSVQDAMQITVQVEALQLQLIEARGQLMESGAELIEARGALIESHSQLIEARGEIVKREARIHLLEHARDELEIIKSSRSWRWMRPMRFAARVIRHRGLTAEDRNRLMRSSRDPAPAQMTHPSLSENGVVDAEVNALHVPPHTALRMVQAELVSPSETLRDFFVWAVIDWHFRIQRPQHLARELAAAGHRVFYVSNHFIDRLEAGFSVESLDSDGRLFQIHLHLRGSPAIYHASPDAAEQAQLHEGICLLLAWTRSRACASLVQHPYWLETSQLLPNQRVIYDCMDHHGGFADNSDEVLAREHELMRDADLLVVTSDWLYAEAGKYNPQCVTIRNACQYEHFSRALEKVFRDSRGRKVIGYYGAIAEWFDLELLEKVAQRFSDCLVLLVGADTCGAHKRLQALDNVQLIGEVPYANLPYYLDGFDVCLLPFQVIPLTLATNPVKVYEYLSAGKAVVSIDLPEIRQFGDLVSRGADHVSFLEAVAAALARHDDAAIIATRQQFAAQQTWAHRVHDLVSAVNSVPQPRVSVVVVTYNNLDLTKACLDSIKRHSDYQNLEVIVVDNASADGTPAYLEAWAAQGDDWQIILNPDNRGFAAANNQGLAQASGDYLVMLNNDTYVTPGWIATLMRHLQRSDALGVVGPVTNNIGNEARIDIRYSTMDEMLLAARDFTTRHAGQLTSLRTAAFFCVMLRRSVFEKVGPLDEAFGIGFFEDDDYCRRVEQAGWTIACADDVFVHHQLSASFNKLKQETRQALFEKNKAIYEAKWGPWEPHRYR